MRFSSQYGLNHYEAMFFSYESAVADYFELAARAGADPKLVANWMKVDLLPSLAREGKTIEQSPVSAEQLAGMIMRIEDKTINNKIGRVVLKALWLGESQTADEAIEAKGLKQINDSGTLEKIVDEVFAKSAAQIADYKAGKEKALMNIVSMVMKASQGKANPAQVNDIVRRKLA